MSRASTILRLVANESTNGKNFDHADWGDAKVTCDDEVPEEPVVVEQWAIDGPEGSPLDGVLKLDSAGRVALDVRRRRDDGGAGAPDSASPAATATSAAA